MKKPFAVFDIDGTLIRWQLYHAIVDTLGRRGYMKPKAYESLRSARKAWKGRLKPDSFKNYELQLVKAYKQLLESLNTEQFDKAVEMVYAEYKDQVYTFTRDLIKQLRKKNYLLFAISGSQSEIVGKIASYYGFDDYIGVIHERDGQRFTGDKQKVVERKHILLEQLMEKHGTTRKGSLGVGDSEGDIDMLEMVAKPIAFNPTKKLFEHARANRWNIVVERKNMVYELKAQNGRYLLAKTD